MYEDVGTCMGFSYCSLRGAALAWPLTLNLKVIESTAVAVHYHIVIIFKLLPTRGHSITIMK